MSEIDAIFPSSTPPGSIFTMSKEGCEDAQRVGSEDLQGLF
jgi:hypothetical protein